MPRNLSVRRLVQSVLIGTLLTFQPFGITSAGASSSLMIGEVAWAGSSASLADEWIELWNTSDLDLSLAGYSLVGAGTKTIFFPDDARVPARSVYLVSNYNENELNSALAVTPQMVTTTISLSNSALSLRLLDSNGILIDQTGDGTTPPAGSSGTIKSSMLLIGGAWMSATTSSGFDLERTELGTPGFCDGCNEALGLDEQPVVNTVVGSDPEPLEPTFEPPINAATSTSPSTDLIVPSSNESELLSLSSSTDAIQETVEPPVETLDSSPTTSSELILEPAVIFTTTSTVVEAPASLISVEPENDTLTSTQTTPTTTEPLLSAIETTNSVATSVTTTTQTPHYEALRLNEVMPNPDGEKEWVEVTLVDQTTIVDLQGVRIQDRTGTIFTFTTGTLDGTRPFFRAYLTASRLNNTGDDVKLLNPQNLILDSFTYNLSEKGQAWARSPDAFGNWLQTSLSTPDANNRFPAVEMGAGDPVEENIDSEKEIEAAETEEADEIEEFQEEQTDLIVTPASNKPTRTTALKSVSTKLKTVSTKSKTKLKSAAATTKTNPGPLPITFDMTNSDVNAGIRVSLQGTVGSPPGLLTGHSFVLLSSDGRGLLVRVPTSRKLPDMGKNLTVQGTLVFNDAGTPSLKLNKNDQWTVLGTVSESNTPRIVDLALPSNEDAWSLVQVVGVIKSIKSGTIMLDLNETDMKVVIKNVVGYRTARLKAGDTLSVKGLLDLSYEEPRLLPRSSEDINIERHAVAKLAPVEPKALPGWTPFGAAGLAIAGTEGYKHLNQKRKQRALEKMLQASSNTDII